jgi:hypothetical protein
MVWQLCIMPTDMCMPIVREQVVVCGQMTHGRIDRIHE